MLKDKIEKRLARLATEHEIAVAAVAAAKERCAQLEETITLLKELLATDATKSVPEPEEASPTGYGGYKTRRHKKLPEDTVRDYGDSRDLILYVLKKARRTLTLPVIQKRTGLSRSHLGVQLRQLMNDGAVLRVMRGKYRAAEL